MKLSEVDISKPITIICHDGTENVENDLGDVSDISPERTMRFANDISADEWAMLKQSAPFMRLFRLVFPDIVLPDHPLQSHGSGVKHIVGLICLTEAAIRTRRRPFWRTPEANLHPRAQTGLADLLIHYTKGGA